MPNDIHSINLDGPEREETLFTRIGDFFEHYWRKFWGWEPMYWLRCHTFTKYHIVDCRNNYSFPWPYDWGWKDRSGLLLIANFNILVEFIETEAPDKFINWEATPEHSHAWSEMQDLYKWWKTGRKQEWVALESLLEDLPHRDWDQMFKPLEGGNGFEYIPEPPEVHQVYQVYRQQEELLEKKDQDNLHRLIDIRNFLWT